MTSENKEHPDLIKARLLKRLLFRGGAEDFAKYGHLCTGLGETPALDARYTRKDQQDLFVALWLFNAPVLTTCVPMPDHHIHHLVWCLDAVPVEVLELVTRQLKEHNQEIRDGKRPKPRTHITQGYLGNMCIAALNATKELEELRQTVPKPPVRRVVL